MSNTAPHERLTAARLALALERDGIASRTGIREPLLAAMEEGRWTDLPHGLYGRAAIRSYASVLGLDVDAFLAECEPLLAPMEDPIAALARMRGLRVHETAAASAATARTPLTPAPLPRRRAIAKALAILIDTSVIAIALALLIAVTSMWIEVPPSALRHTAGAFATMGMLFAGSYYLVFAGIGGRTPGDWLACASGEPQESVRQDRPRAASRRAAASFLRDARLIATLGRALRAVTRRRQASRGTGPDGAPADGERLAF